MANKKFALSVLIEAVDKFTAPMRAITDKINKVMAPVRKLGMALKEMSAASGLTRLAGSLKSVAEGVKGVGAGMFESFKRIGELALLETGFGFLIKQTAEAGHELETMAERAGMGVQEYQELSYAAKRAGVEQEQFNMATKELAVNMGALHARSGSLYTLLARVAPNLEERLRGSKSMGESFTVIMEAIARLKDPAKQAELAAAAFGGRGEEMVNLARMGSVEIAKLRKNFRDLGGGFTDDGAKTATEFNDSLQDLMVSITGARNRIMVALFPALQKLVKQLTDYIVGHGKDWVTWAQNFAAGLPETISKIQDALKSLYGILQTVGGAVKWLTDTFGAANVIMVTLAAWIFGPLIASLVALVPSLMAVGEALLLTPFGWFVIGVGLIIGAIYLLREPLAWIGEAIGGFIWEAVDLIQRLPKAFMDMVHSIEKAVKDKWDAVWDAIGGTVAAVVDTITDAFQGAVKFLDGLVPNWVKNIFGGSATVTVNGNTTQSGAPSSAAPDGTVPGAQARAPGGDTKHEVALKVAIVGAPAGTTVRQTRNTGVPVDMSLGYHSASF